MIRVEHLYHYDAVAARVEGRDSVAGVYMQGGRAAAGDIRTFASRKVESTGSIILSIIAISILLMAMVLAGAVPGLMIVGERESNALSALASAPVLGLYALILAATQGEQHSGDGPRGEGWATHIPQGGIWGELVVTRTGVASPNPVGPGEGEAHNRLQVRFYSSREIKVKYSKTDAGMAGIFKWTQERYAIPR